MGKKGSKPNSYKAARRIDNVGCGNEGTVTAGGRHAWYNSPVGIVRKPLEK